MAISHVIALVAGAVLLVPLLAVYFLVSPTEAAANELPSVAGYESLVASLIVASVAAVLAVIVGTSFALLFGLTNFPARNFASTIALVPLLAPPTVWTLQQVYCYGAGGLVENCLGATWAAIREPLNRGNYLATTLVLAQIQAPLAMLLVGRGLGRFDHAGWEAARFFLRPRALAAWLLRAVQPEITSALLLSVALGLGSFAVPHVLQCRLYPVEVYMQSTNYLDHAAAVRMAWPLVLLALVATTLMVLSERRNHTAAGPARRIPHIKLGRWLWPCGAAWVFYLTATTMLPLAALVQACRSAGDFSAAVRAAAPETQSSLWIAAGAGGVACCAGLALGSCVGTRMNLAAQWLAILPLAVPPLVVGLAYAIFVNQSWPFNLSTLGNHSGLVILGLAARTLPFAARIASGGQRSIARQWNDAAQLADLSTFRRWRWITWPLMLPHAVAAFLVAAVLSLGEVEISQMLCAPGSGTLALRLFTFLHFGPLHVAASLAVLQLALAVLPLLIYFFLTNRYPQVV